MKKVTNQIIAKQLYECLAALSATYGIGLSARYDGLEEKWTELGVSAISDLENIYELWGKGDAAASTSLKLSSFESIKCLKERVVRLQTLTNTWTDSLRLIKLQMKIEKRWLNVLSRQVAECALNSELDQLMKKSGDRIDELAIFIKTLSERRLEVSQSSLQFEKSVLAMSQLAKGKNV